MQDIKARFPSVQIVLDAPLIDLAESVLRHVGRKIQQVDDCDSAKGFLSAIRTEYGNEKSVLIAFAEAWDWLQANGLICSHPLHTDHWTTLTRNVRTVL